MWMVARYSFLGGVGLPLGTGDGVTGPPASPPPAQAPRGHWMSRIFVVPGPTALKPKKSVPLPLPTAPSSAGALGDADLLRELVQRGFQGLCLDELPGSGEVVVRGTGVGAAESVRCLRGYGEFEY